MLEELSPDQWQYHAGSYSLRDVDGYAVREFGEGAFADKRRVQSRIPVLIGTRDSDAFWWYQGAAYRCNRGLNWWDVAALVANGAAARVSPTPVAYATTDRPATPPLPVRTARALALHLRQHGLTHTLRKAEERLRPHVHLAESHVWYVRRLTDPIAETRLPDGLEVARGGPDELAALDELPTPVSRAEGERRLAAGAHLWVVSHAGMVASAAWLFTDFAPVIAAPRGRLRLPARHAMLEDVATAETYRGRGVGPALWIAVAAQLQRAGFARLLTKRDINNAAAERAFAKAGLVEGAIVHLRRTMATNHVRVEELASTEVAVMLRQRLG